VEGFHARVVQHECDHLDGILYPMRMPDLSLLGFEEEMSRYPLQSSAGSPEEEEDEEEDV
jgi:peptide deformylase